MSSSDEAEFRDDVLVSSEHAKGSLHDDDDDDMPLANLLNSRKRSSTRTVSYADEDDDSEDDVPLASLAKRKPTVTSKHTNGSVPKSKVATPKKVASATTASVKKKKPTKSTSTVSNSSNADKTYESASAALYGTQCDKGLLIQRLLCRWWYAMTWPDPATLPVRPPKRFDALDGFTGVYVCTEGDKVGQIRDLRDKTTCPSFQIFVRKDAEELRQLLLKALEEQRAQLVAKEGSGTPTEKEIDQLVKWAKKVNTTKADKDAVKVLKASGLSIP
jgi:hypothetical protein